MSSQPIIRFTPEEYLEAERIAEVKHEYWHGEIFAMAGGTPEHSFVTTNIYIALGALLRDKRCFIFNSDLRVSVRWGELITYPDVTVSCGELEYVDGHQDTLVNPAFVVEVLSPSTEKTDRGEKRFLYQKVPSMTEFLLVDQKPTLIEHFRKLPDGKWEISTIEDRAAVIELRSLGVTLPVAEIYRNFEFLRVRK